MALTNLLSKIVLLPCSKLYGAATYLRNKFFDIGLLKQMEFDVPVIAVGNLTAGGTGKTPMVEHIVEIFRHEKRVAVLSRGYKRETRGFVTASKISVPRDIGDEPYQIYRKFNGDVIVAVCEDRVQGIRRILEINPAIDLIVLDDAFQHRYVKPTLSVVVSEYNRPFYNESMLPYGRLREPKRGINRADMVVVSKCPQNLKPYSFRQELNNYGLQAWQQIFFSHFVYQPLIPVFEDSATAVPYLDWLNEGDGVLAVAGIGNPRPFVRHIKSHAAKVRVDIFADHHQYTKRDFEHLLQRFTSMKGNRKIIVTTEKDAVRMAANSYFPHELRPYTFYLPVSIDFVYPFGPPSFAEALKKTLRERIRERNN